MTSNGNAWNFIAKRHLYWQIEAATVAQNLAVTRMSPELCTGQEAL